MLAALGVGCGRSATAEHPYGAVQAALGQSLATQGWNLSVSNLRFEANHVLIDVDASPSNPSAPRTNPADLRFGLYGALSHAIEADAMGSCDQVQGADIRPLTVPLGKDPDRMSGAVCIGPITDQAQVRGVYVYSPRDRMPGTTVAYPAAFPVGLTPTNVNDTGLIVSTTSVEAWRADGKQLTPASLGDPAAFAGKGYMLLGLKAEAIAAEYRDDAARRGGPLMLVVAPTLPPPGINPACSIYGGSVLVLPDASLDAVRLSTSLCTQGEINAAVLYPTVSVIGTHAAVWTRTDR